MRSRQTEAAPRRAAAALARALEEVTLRVEGAEDLEPYPGLAAFTEADAEYFFGRELEVEEMWKKLQRPHLLGADRPLGCRQELVPASRPAAGDARPAGELWSATPGSTSPSWRWPARWPRSWPVTQSAVQELAALRRARCRGRRSSRAGANGMTRRCSIVDQFEELFTLNPPEVQERFAELLGRLALEADVHVLLSMRDDFLFYCSQLRELCSRSFAS